MHLQGKTEDFFALKQKIPEFFFKTLDSHKILYQVLIDLRRLLQDACHKTKLYVCGGIVRDIAISTSVVNYPFRFFDIDMVVENVRRQLLDHVMERLKQESLHVQNVFYVGALFSVWNIQLHDLPYSIDLAMTRSEQSLGPHHRDFDISIESVDIKTDSKRRDFTINSLYLELQLDDEGSLTGKISDMQHGLEDILSRRIRCVGTPRKRFFEDPLRMLRAIRFRAKLPGFSIDPDTAKAMVELVPQLLDTVAIERVADECYKALSANPNTTIQDFTEYSVMSQIYPELAALPGAYLDRTRARLRNIRKQSTYLSNHSFVFAALLQEIAFFELGQKMRRHLSRIKINHRFFHVDSVRKIARRTRLPGIRLIARLCNDVLAFAHYDLLECADAVVEQIIDRYPDPSLPLALYRANQEAFRVEAVDFLKNHGQYAPSSIDFQAIVQESGIPTGPHIQDIKLRLRQAEIEGELRTDLEAKELLNKLYMENTFIIQEHIDNIKEILHSDPLFERLAPELNEEIRWLLFTHPVLLIQSYHENGLLPAVFPELDEAEKTVNNRSDNFVRDFLNNATLALSILCEETPDHTPVHILSLLFLDVFTTRDICKRLEVDNSITDDVQFIIDHHHTLTQPDGPESVRRLLQTVDEHLIDDLLLIHKIDQMCTMKIAAGRRVDEGQLKNYHVIQANLEKWKQEIRKRLTIL